MILCNAFLFSELEGALRGSYTWKTRQGSFSFLFRVLVSSTKVMLIDLSLLILFVLLKVLMLVLVASVRGKRVEGGSDEYDRLVGLCVEEEEEDKEGEGGTGG